MLNWKHKFAMSFWKHKLTKWQTYGLSLTTTRAVVDVLKVAHHGSKTSSTEAWLQYWSAQSAVISAGANNTYGHPNPGVLERLEAVGSQIYRTDQMGEIQMRIKDGKIDVRQKLIVDE
ncbi:ComE operon protein 3 [Paenibacillus illinoisensis]|uniref:ComE operon protein 3 n=1 Tax=Paenibacillus illinoisensis TaxID=59845 RepID=A0A2W0CV67_9BACL|nr:ComE operon protein 3 [Paenibacillus illinoisensis]